MNGKEYKKKIAIVDKMVEDLYKQYFNNTVKDSDLEVYPIVIHIIAPFIKADLTLERIHTLKALPGIFNRIKQSYYKKLLLSYEEESDIFFKKEVSYLNIKQIVSCQSKLRNEFAKALQVSLSTSKDVKKDNTHYINRINGEITIEQK